MRHHDFITDGWMRETREYQSDRHCHHDNDLTPRGRGVAAPLSPGPLPPVRSFSEARAMLKRKAHPLMVQCDHITPGEGETAPRWVYHKTCSTCKGLGCSRCGQTGRRRTSMNSEIR